MNWGLFFAVWCLAGAVVALWFGRAMARDAERDERERLARFAQQIQAEHGEPDWREARADYEQARNDAAAEWHGAA